MNRDVQANLVMQQDLGTKSDGTCRHYIRVDKD